MTTISMRVWEGEHVVIAFPFVPYRSISPELRMGDFRLVIVQPRISIPVTLDALGWTSCMSLCGGKGCCRNAFILAYTLLSLWTLEQNGEQCQIYSAMSIESAGSSSLITSLLLLPMVAASTNHFGNGARANPALIRERMPSCMLVPSNDKWMRTCADSVGWLGLYKVP